jgi:hypothetical protein
MKKIPLKGSHSEAVEKAEVTMTILSNLQRSVLKEVAVVQNKI